MKRWLLLCWAWAWWTGGGGLAAATEAGTGPPKADRGDWTAAGVLAGLILALSGLTAGLAALQQFRRRRQGSYTLPHHLLPTAIAHKEPKDAKDAECPVAEEAGLRSGPAPPSPSPSAPTPTVPVEAVESPPTTDRTASSTGDDRSTGTERTDDSGTRTPSGAGDARPLMDAVLRELRGRFRSHSASSGQTQPPTP